MHCPSCSLRSGSLGGTLERTLDYGPYGESLGTDWAATSAPAARKLFIGKEKLKSDDTELYDFGARRYDPALPRWTSVDPLAGKYPGLSPYAYCAGNPIILVDRNGSDHYYFDSNGYFIGKISADGEHRLYIRSGTGADEDPYFFQEKVFADSVNDPIMIDNNETKYRNKPFLVTVPDQMIRAYLQETRAFNGLLVSLIQSDGGQRYDYSSKESLSKYQGDDEEAALNSSLYLFAPEGELYVHNLMNFGNYLWGATGYTLGWPLEILLIGADAYTWKKDQKRDSVDDQLSISQGVQHAKENSYRRVYKHIIEQVIRNQFVLWSVFSNVYF